MILRNSLPRVQAFLRPAGLTRSAAQLLCRLMLAFCCHYGRMSAHAAASLPRADGRHRASPGRFLGRKRWAQGDWMLPLRQLLLNQAAKDKPEGTYFFLIDPSLFSRQGEKTPNTFSSGNRKRRPAKGRRYSNKKTKPKRCHCFVFALLLTPWGVRVPYKKSYYTEEYCKQTRRAYRTQTELAAQMILELELPAGAKVVFLGDTAFDAACIHKACAQRGFHWITPCNSERVLAGPKPRPKVRTTLLDEASQKAFVAVKLHPDTDPYAPQRRWSKSALERKQKGRTYWVRKEKHTIHSVGEVLVLLSTTKRPKKGEELHEPKILLCSELSLSAREVVLRYTLRWQIEVFFKECKSHLGMGQYRFKDFERAERWVEVALLSYLYLEWYRWGKLEQQAKTEEEREHWSAQRTAGLQAAVRAECSDEELCWLEKRLATPGGRKRLRRLIRASLPRPLRRSLAKAPDKPAP
jgi:hypothetical protein